MPGVAVTREEFDLKWREWSKSAEGPRKQRLLNRMVIENTPLVHKFVDRILNRSSVYVDLDDAMQAGLIGLVVALKKYDPKRPTRFSTMCWPWVRHEVQNMLLHQTQLYRPKGSGMPYQEHRMTEMVQARDGREATAEDLHVTPEKFDKWKQAVFSFVPLDEVRERVNEDGGEPHQRLNHLAASDVPVDEQVAQKELERRLMLAINDLTPAERRVIIDGDTTWLSLADAEQIRSEGIAWLRLMLLG